MLNNICEAIFKFAWKMGRIYFIRGDFKDTVIQLRALLDSLEAANMSDEAKNELLDAEYINMFIAARRLRDK